MLIYSTSSISNVKNDEVGDFIILGGTIGPLFVVQSGLEAMLSLRIHKFSTIDTYIGSVSTNSTSPSNQNDYGGIGWTYFPVGSIFKKFASEPNVFFTRLSYAYHDYAKVTGRRNKISLWTEKSHGFEIGAGARVSRGKVIFEIVPILAYLPIWKKRSGTVIEKQNHLRLFSLKVGYRF